MTYASDDSDWSKKVAERYGGKCGWVTCGETFGLGGHHIIPRGLKATRLIIENGILLCTKHHTEVEEVKGTPAYDRMMEILVGKVRYYDLKKLEVEALTEIVHNSLLEIKEISSEVSL